VFNKRYGVSARYKEYHLELHLIAENYTKKIQRIHRHTFQNT